MSAVSSNRFFIPNSESFSLTSAAYNLKSDNFFLNSCITISKIALFPISLIADLFYISFNLTIGNLYRLIVGTEDNTEVSENNDITEETSYELECFPYAELKRTPEQCEAISFIINTSSRGYVYAAWNLRELLKKGKLLDGLIHPFKFIGYIISNPELKDKLRIILDRNDRIKREFVGPLASAINDRALANRLSYSDHLEGFAQETQKEVSEIQKHIQNRDFESLLYYLIS